MQWFDAVKARAVSDMLEYHQDLQTKITGNEIDDSFFLRSCEDRFNTTFNFISKQWCGRRMMNKQDGYSAETIAELNALELEITIATLTGIGVGKSTAKEIAESFVQ